MLNFFKKCAVRDELRTRYNGTPITDNQWFDVELVSKLIADMANGKAPGLDELTSEHVKYSHPIVVSILTKLFNMFISHGHIPASFGRSYTVQYLNVMVLDVLCLSVTSGESLSVRLCQKYLRRVSWTGFRCIFKRLTINLDLKNI